MRTRRSSSLPPAKRRRLSPLSDGVSLCATPSVGDDSRRIAGDVAINTGVGIVPAMFESLSLDDLEIARRESNLRSQYFLALSESARKQADAASEHTQTLNVLLALKKEFGRKMVATTSI